MPRGTLLVTLILASAHPGPASAQPSKSDAHPLSQSEMANFLPFVCLKPVRRATNDSANNGPTFSCQGLIGYPDENSEESDTIALTAVMYGRFTARDAHEAYVSYLSSREPHSADFGGGILLRSDGEHWRLIRWYPGEAMQHCLALPGHGPRKTLCLAEYVGQSERDTSVLKKAVMKAQDDRGAIAPDETNSRSYPCILGGHQHKAMLHSIDSLTRSTSPDELAVSHITYATAQSVAAACAAGHFENVRTNTGTAYYRIEGGRVLAIVPEPFSKTDY
jgi:hypothetical protein